VQGLGQHLAKEPEAKKVDEEAQYPAEYRDIIMDKA
jgi:hypothetical protein